MLAGQNRPTHLIMDLDPPEGGDFTLAVRAAHLVRQALADAGLIGAVKTTGSKGLHVFVPLEDGFHRVSTPASGVIGCVREHDGRYEVLRGRVRQATRSEGAYSTMNVALIALTHA